MIRTLLLLFACAILISCGSSSERNTEEVTAHETTRIQQHTFGKMPDGEEVHEYTISNSNGMQVSIITYGGIIRTLLVPDKNGELADVVLGYDSLQGYLDSNPYFGAIVGRYGNRIAKGQFSLDGADYQLATNNLGNHLHGGVIGFDKVLWEATVMQEGAGPVLRMTYLSKDMEEGYPGNLEVTVDYRLTEENELSIEYQATTDKKTIVNLTSHSYFNLSSAADILSHQLQINAANYLPIDETLIPLDITPVADTPFDFKILKAIGTDINQQDEQLTNGAGYDHCWVLDASDEHMNLAARLYDAQSGRKMEMYTTEPGLQFYSGNFLDGTITGKGSKVYHRRSGLCLETQHFPDSPNRPDFPSTILSPGEVYRTKTVHKFSVE
ncbi:MAG: aldose epimerase family protein [Cytophagales bacterium]|nr:aldose epimerase family protein [Cytophagales bacterium]